MWYTHTLWCMYIQARYNNLLPRPGQPAVWTKEKHLEQSSCPITSPSYHHHYPSIISIPSLSSSLPPSSFTSSPNHHRHSIISPLNIKPKKIKGNLICLHRLCKHEGWRWRWRSRNPTSHVHFLISMMSSHIYVLWTSSSSSSFVLSLSRGIEAWWSDGLVDRSSSCLCVLAVVCNLKILENNFYKMECKFVNWFLLLILSFWAWLYIFCYIVCCINHH